MLPDKAFESYQIIADWAKYRKQYSISINPCAFRALLATLVATLGAYIFVPRLFSNFTPKHAMALSLDLFLQVGTGLQLMAMVKLPQKNSAESGYLTTGESHTSLNDIFIAWVPTRGDCRSDHYAAD